MTHPLWRQQFAPSAEDERRENERRLEEWRRRVLGIRELPIEPPSIDERNPPRVQEIVLRRALADRGWTDEAIDWYVRTVPTIYETSNRGSYGGPPGNEIARIGSASDPGFQDFTINHEAQHAWDDQRGGLIPADELEALSRDTTYFLAAQAAREILSTLAPRNQQFVSDGNEINHPTGNTYDRHDPLHYGTGLAEKLNHDYGLLPPGMVKQRFGFAKPGATFASEQHRSDSVRTEEELLWKQAHQAPIEHQPEMPVRQTRWSNPRHEIASEIATLLLDAAQARGEFDESEGDGSLPGPLAAELRRLVGNDEELPGPYPPPRSTIRADEGPYPGSLPTPLVEPDPIEQFAQLLGVM